MTDPINQEIKVAMVDTSYPNFKETKDSHGTAVARVLNNAILYDGYKTNPDKIKLTAYVDFDFLEVKKHESYEEFLKEIIADGNNIITSSVLFCNKEDGILSVNKIMNYEKHIVHLLKDVLFFQCSSNNALNACHVMNNNNHRFILVGALYDKSYIKNDTLYRNAPGSGVLISYSGFTSKGGWGTSFATPKVAGSAGIIACRNLKPRTQGDFPILVKKYLAFSALHVKQDELLKGWPTDELSHYMRDVQFNGAKDCNLGEGLGFSYEHGTGEYNNEAFHHLCLSHLSEFDIQLQDHVYFAYQPYVAAATKKIVFQFNPEEDCGTSDGYVDGVYFHFNGIKTMDIKKITLVSPSGSRSELVNEYTSLRSRRLIIPKTADDDEEGKELDAELEELELENLRFQSVLDDGYRYFSNRHFGEELKGKWRVIIETYEHVTKGQEVQFSLDFRRFNQKNKNIIINDNIFKSSKNQFIYQNSVEELDYLNLSAAYSINEVDLKRRKATLIKSSWTFDDQEIRTIKEVIIDPHTTIEYVAGGRLKDRIIGNEHNNKLLGLGGADILYGEEGDDHLYPGSAVSNDIKGPYDLPDQGYGGIGNDTHHVFSYDIGEYWIYDDQEGQNSLIFNVSYELSNIGGKFDYLLLTLDDVKFTKTSDTEYWMQGGNKKARFNPAEIQSVVLKHSLTGEVRTLDRAGINALCSR